MTIFARIDAPSSLVLDQETAPDELASGQVEVTITLCGICATDTHNYTSGGQIPPATFGHEWTGTIARVASDVTSVEVGQRVIACVGAACGTCPMCLAGHADHCDTAFAEANGVTPDSPAHGGFATSLVVSARRVMPVLDGLDVAEPVEHRHDTPRRHDQGGGEAAVDGGVGRDAVGLGEGGVAVIGMAGQTHRTRAARGTDASDDPLPGGDRRDVRGHAGDRPGPLVPEGGRRDLAAGRVVVGVGGTDAAQRDGDLDLPGCQRVRARLVVEDEGAGGVDPGESSHASTVTSG